MEKQQENCSTCKWCEKNGGHITRLQITYDVCGNQQSSYGNEPCPARGGCMDWEGKQ